MSDTEHSEPAQGSEQGSAAPDQSNSQDPEAQESENHEQHELDNPEKRQEVVIPADAGAVDFQGAGENPVDHSALEVNAEGQETGGSDAQGTSPQEPDAAGVAQGTSPQEPDAAGVATGDDLDKVPADKLRAMIRNMRAEHAEQLDTEARARAEVEDMCLRIEKHFAAEKVWQLPLHFLLEMLLF
jgi:hypothetical protein